MFTLYGSPLLVKLFNFFRKLTHRKSKLDSIYDKPNQVYAEVTPAPRMDTIVTDGLTSEDLQLDFDTLEPARDEKDADAIRRTYEARGLDDRDRNVEPEKGLDELAAEHFHQYDSDSNYQKKRKQPYFDQIVIKKKQLYGLRKLEQTITENDISTRRKAITAENQRIEEARLIAQQLEKAPANKSPFDNITLMIVLSIGLLAAFAYYVNVFYQFGYVDWLKEARQLAEATDDSGFSSIFNGQAFCNTGLHWIFALCFVAVLGLGLHYLLADSSRIVRILGISIAILVFVTDAALAYTIEKRQLDTLQLIGQAQDSDSAINLNFFVLMVLGFVSTLAVMVIFHIFRANWVKADPWLEFNTEAARKKHTILGLTLEIEQFEKRLVTIRSSITILQEQLAELAKRLQERKVDMWALSLKARAYIKGYAEPAGQQKHGQTYDFEKLLTDFYARYFKSPELSFGSIMY